jgi:hypothetical protein
VLVAACGGSDGVGGPTGTPRSALLVLPRTDSAPPPPRTFAVRNDRLETFRWVHGDAGGTLFAEFRFTPRSILRVGGQMLCDTCTVLVTVSPLPGLYGFTVGPPSLVFNAAGSPTVSVSYGVYGDLSVHDSSARYPSPAAYSAALAIWYETSGGVWDEERNSAHLSATVVASALDLPTTHLVAALK